MLVVIFNYKDILGLYEDKNKNVVIFDWKIIKGDDQFTSLAVDFITKTQIAVKLNLKVSTSSNVPVLYNRIFKDLSNLLIKHKLNLRQLRFSIIGAS
jgi:hypothetical protein